MPRPRKNRGAGGQSKYRNRVTYVDGERFDSMGEANRWKELLLLLQAGKIANLKRQVGFDLHAAGGKKVCHYVADFVYEENGKRVVEDYKGFRTDIYKLKRKFLLAEYGIEIRETGL